MKNVVVRRPVPNLGRTAFTVQQINLDMRTVCVRIKRMLYAATVNFNVADVVCSRFLYVIPPQMMGLCLFHLLGIVAQLWVLLLKQALTLNFPMDRCRMQMHVGVTNSRAS